ncbi:unnamed protein product [Clavelina lepadiformis]|uniref:Uncharacterized protein n=1 Tax=Clavelina lepadiformis TaxID=159417 RepID=A0ABP0G2C0_CLALP
MPRINALTRFAPASSVLVSSSDSENVDQTCTRANFVGYITGAKRRGIIEFKSYKDFPQSKEKYCDITPASPANKGSVWGGEVSSRSCELDSIFRCASVAITSLNNV